MKTVIIIISIMGIFQLLFGCKQTPIENRTLYGDWEAIKLNDDPIESHGFISIKMKISPDSLQIVTQMKSFGDITTKSEGTWELKDLTFVSKLGDSFKKSKIKLSEDYLIFTPDPLFKSETVFKSEYRKVHE